MNERLELFGMRIWDLGMRNNDCRLMRCIFATLNLGTQDIMNGGIRIAVQFPISSFHIISSIPSVFNTINKIVF